jgi:5-methylcytosine-specific restriction endonuclease McrA
MLATWGDGSQCPCVHCGGLLSYTTVEADRIIPGSQGGSYRRENVQPACRRCNASRQDNPDWVAPVAVAA